MIFTNTFIFIILLLLLLVIILLLKLPAKWKQSLYRNTKWKILIGYIVILTFVTIIYLTFVQPNYVEPDRAENVPMIHDLVYSEKLDELPSQYMINKWTTQVEENSLEINIGEGSIDNFSIPIVVEERPDKEKNAEVILYETPSTLYNLDISNQVPLANIHVAGNKLTVTEEDDFIELYYHSIKNEDFVSQFKNNVILPTLDFQLGEQVLFLIVPKNTKIKVDEDLFYVVHK